MANPDKDGEDLGEKLEQLSRRLQEMEEARRRQELDMARLQAELVEAKQRLAVTSNPSVGTTELEFVPCEPSVSRPEELIISDVYPANLSVVKSEPIVDELDTTEANTEEDTDPFVSLPSSPHRLDENTSSYICITCNKAFKKKKTYNKHLQRHLYLSTRPDMKTASKASVSKLSAPTRISLDRQSKNKVQLTNPSKRSTSYNCYECKQTFRVKRQLNFHLKRKHIKQRLHCSNIDTQSSVGFQSSVVATVTPKLKKNVTFARKDKVIITDVVKVSGGFSDITVKELQTTAESTANSEQTFLNSSLCNISCSVKQFFNQPSVKFHQNTEGITDLQENKHKLQDRKDQSIDCSANTVMTSKEAPLSPSDSLVKCTLCNMSFTKKSYYRKHTASQKHQIQINKMLGSHNLNIKKKSSKGNLVCPFCSETFNCNNFLTHKMSHFSSYEKESVQSSSHIDKPLSNDCFQKEDKTVGSVESLAKEDIIPCKDFSRERIRSPCSDSSTNNEKTHYGYSLTGKRFETSEFGDVLREENQIPCSDFLAGVGKTQCGGVPREEGNSSCGNSLTDLTTNFTVRSISENEKSFFVDTVKDLNKTPCTDSLTDNGNTLYGGDLREEDNNGFGNTIADLKTGFSVHSLPSNEMSSFDDSATNKTPCSPFTLLQDLSKKKQRSSCNGNKTKTITYSCLFCGENFSNKKSLCQHCKTHAKSEPEPKKPNLVKCDECGKILASASLKPHKKNVHCQTPPKFNCELCNRPFQTEFFLKKHLLSHCATKPFMCSHCGRTFNRRSNLDHHVLCFHLDSKPYLCAKCGRKFSYKAHLEQHEMRHQGIAPFPCKQCSTAFNSNTALTLHYKNVHGIKFHMKDVYKCPICDKSFDYYYAFHRHRMSHNEKAEFQCDLCPKKFHTRLSLQYHQMTHSKSKNSCSVNEQDKEATSSVKVYTRSIPKSSFQCDICSREFPYKCYLKYHQIVHSNLKPHVCKICGKKFRRSFQLMCHEYVHKDERPLYCATCGKGFIKKQHLKAHDLVKHQGRRDHVCTTCGKTFTTSTNLRAHEKLHDPGQIVTCGVCGKTFSIKRNLTVHLKKCHLLHKENDCS